MFDGLTQDLGEYLSESSQGDLTIEDAKPQNARRLQDKTKKASEIKNSHAFFFLD